MITIGTKDTIEYGFIIHWGIYSIPAYNPPRKTKTQNSNGSEWYLGRLKNSFLYGTKTIDYHTEHHLGLDYYMFLDEFERASRNWNPQLWMDVIKKAGGKYAILTAKHHDGVVLYPSKVPGTNTKRDYVGEFVKCCRANGIKVGIYYSLLDWDTTKQNPFSKGKKKIVDYVVNVLHPQLKEIVENYDPDILWVDGDWNHEAETWKSDSFLRWWFARRPDGITNSRWGKNYNGQFRDKVYRTDTDRMLSRGGGGQWEYVGTIGKSWGFAKGDEYRSTQSILNDYRTVKNNRGSRFTLNLGPMPDGTLHPGEVKGIISLPY